MRLALVFLLALGTATEVVVLARSSGRPSTASSSPTRRSSSRGSSSSRGGSSGRTGGSSRRPRNPIDDDDDDDDDPRFEDIEDNVDDNAGGGDDYDYDDDDYEEENPASRRRGPASSSSSSSGGGRRRVPTPGRRPGARFENSNYEDEDEHDEYDEEYYSPSRSSSSSARRRSGGPPPPPSTRHREGRVVSYNNSRSSSSSTRRRGRPPPNPPSTFTRGLSAIRDRMPDPNTVKDTVLSATKAAQERTAQLSSNIYREVKGLTSSELEQVMLKATRPDETPVKTKHVERLVGVTYQISGKYDIYDAVLRKLWNKMAEKDIRTKLKSVYILHRFAVDGGPDHQEALKQRLRALRKTKDPKRASSGGGGGRGGGGSTRYFDSKVLLGVDDDPDNQGYRAFLSRYAHYVLTRAQTFGGIFNEISLASMPTSSSPPPSKKGGGRSKSKSDTALGGGKKPKNPPLCEEHLKFAQMVLKAGLACTLHEGEDSESTAMCVERVAADLMGLTAAVATALKRELKQSSLSLSSSSDELTKQWCEFYAEELLPETKKFCKKVTNKLDAYGLYLPSRISASLSPELLEKGLKLGGGTSRTTKNKENDEGEEDKEEEEGEAAAEAKKQAVEEKAETCEEEEERGEDVGGEKEAEAGDASMAMRVNAATPSTQENEDEYDDEYDEYDEYD